MRLRHCGPRAVEGAGVRQHGRGLTQEDRSGGEPADALRPRHTGERVEHLGGRTMALPPAAERRCRPLGPPRGEEPGQAPGILDAGGTRAWAEAGHDQRPGGAGETAPGQRAIPPGVVVRERQCLLPMGRGIGVSEGEHAGGWGGHVTGEALVHQCPGEAREVRAVAAVCQAGAGGSTGQVVGGGSR
jgi:hypothetical protein